MKLVQLQYPDEASRTKIIDDLTMLSRNIGQAGHRAVAAFNDGAAGFEGIRNDLIQRQVPVGTLSPPNQATVTSGTPIPVTGGTVVFTVVGGVITGGTFTAA